MYDDISQANFTKSLALKTSITNLTVLRGDFERMT